MSIFCPKLIAVDMDGTILNSSSELSPRTKKALRSAISCGVPVVVATGRMYPSALPVIKEIGINSPCIFYNGAVVREPVSGEILLEKGLGKELTAEVVSFFRERDGIYRFTAMTGFMLKTAATREAGSMKRYQKYLLSRWENISGILRWIQLNFWA